MLDWKRCLAALVLFILAAQAWAADVDGLYQASVAVQSQGAEERDQAVGEALLEVLVKLTGRTDIGTHAGIQTALATPTRFVQQFRYLSESAPGAQAPGLLLAVHFDPAALTDLLRQHELPLWGRARPSTLLWLAVERKGRRELIGAHSASDLAGWVTAQAQRRGLPLQLPLLDLTDQAGLSPADVWGGFEDSILRASARYQTEAVLAGRVYAARGGWQGRWILFQGETREQWEVTGEDARAVLEAGVDGASSRLAQRFAQVLGSGIRDAVLVDVYEVRTLADYSRAVKALESLSPVQAVRPAGLHGETVTFRLETRGGLPAVIQAVRLGRSFVPVERTVTAPVEPEDAQMAAAPEAELILRLLQP